MKKPMLRQTIKQSTDIVHDAAILLHQVGVIEIDERALEIAVHEIINAQDLVNHAAGLFFNRNRQGLITLNQLLATVQQAAA